VHQIETGLLLLAHHLSEHEALGGEAMTKFIKLFAIVALTMCFPLGTADAGLQTASGAQCMPYVLGGANDDWEVTEYGEIINVNGSANLYLLCPIRRQGPDVGVANPTLVVHDRNPTAGKVVDCTLKCVDDDAATASTTNATTGCLDSGTCGTGGSDGIEDFYSLDLSSTASDYEYGACLFVCQVPPQSSGQRSGISKYRANI
jgi:hypothetical protein